MVGTGRAAPVERRRALGELASGGQFQESGRAGARSRRPMRASCSLAPHFRPRPALAGGLKLARWAPVVGIVGGKNKARVGQTPPGAPSAEAEAEAVTEAGRRRRGSVPETVRCAVLERPARAPAPPAASLCLLLDHAPARALTWTRRRRAREAAFCAPPGRKSDARSGWPLCRAVRAPSVRRPPSERCRAPRG